MIYAGIGSRKTPDHVQELMKSTAQRLAKSGWTLRSGGAQGADSAFENGAIGGEKEIFLPWSKFNGNNSPLYFEAFPDHIQNKAMWIASTYHPRWLTLKCSVQLLMARNVMQILGPDLETPSMYVICWTPDGKFSGGTGQALRIAHDYNIRIINLYETCKA